MRQADFSSCSLLGMTNPLGFCELFRPALHWLRMHFIYGINAVTEALKPRCRAFEWVGVAKDRHDLRLQRVVEETRKNGIVVSFVLRAELHRMVGNNAHEGQVALTSFKQYSDLYDVVDAMLGQYSLVVM